MKAAQSGHRDFVGGFEPVGFYNNQERYSKREVVSSVPGVDTLRGEFDCRVVALSQIFQSLANALEHDEVIAALRLDPATAMHIPSRIQEFIQEGLSSEREQYVKSLMERFAFEKNKPLEKDGQSIAAKDEKIRTLTGQLERLDGKSKSLMTQLKNMENFKHDAEEEHRKALQMLRDTLKSDMTYREQSIQQQKELESLQEKLEAQRQYINDREESEQHSKRQLATSEDLVSGLRREVKSLRDLINEKNPDLLAEEVVHLKNEREKQRKRGDEYKSAAAQLKKLCKRIKYDLQRAQEDLKRTNEDKEYLEKKYVSLTERVESVLLEDESRAKEVVDKLKRQLKSYREKMRDDNKKSNAALTEYSQEIRTLKRKLGHSTGQIQDKDQVIINLKEKLSSQGEELAKSETALKISRTQSKTIQMELNKTSLSLAASKEKDTDLRRRKEELEQEVDSLRNSMAKSKKNYEQDIQAQMGDEMNKLKRRYEVKISDLEEQTHRYQLEARESRELADKNIRMLVQESLGQSQKLQKDGVEAVKGAILNQVQSLFKGTITVQEHEKVLEAKLQALESRCFAESKQLLSNYEKDCRGKVQGEFTRRLQQLGDENEELSHKIRVMENELHTTVVKNKALTLDNRNMTDRVASMVETMSGAKAKADDELLLREKAEESQRQEVANHKKQQQELEYKFREELESLTDEYSSRLAKQKVDYETTIQRLEYMAVETQEQHKMTVEKLRNDMNDEMQTLIDERSKWKAESETHIASLKDRSSQLHSSISAELDSLRNKLETEREAHAVVIKERDELVVRLQVASKAIADVDGTVGQMRTQYENVRSNYESTATELMNMQKRVEESSQALVAERERSEGLQRELQESKESFAQQSQNLELLHASANIEQKGREREEGERLKTEKLLAAANARVAETLAEINTADSQLKSAEQASADLASKNDELVSKLAETERQKAAADDKILFYQGLNKQAEDRVQNLQETLEREMASVTGQYEAREHQFTEETEQRVTVLKDEAHKLRTELSEAQDALNANQQLMRVVRSTMVTELTRLRGALVILKDEYAQRAVDLQAHVTESVGRLEREQRLKQETQIRLMENENVNESLNVRVVNAENNVQALELKLVQERANAQDLESRCKDLTMSVEKLEEQAVRLEESAAKRESEIVDIHHQRVRGILAAVDEVVDLTPEIKDDLLTDSPAQIIHGVQELASVLRKERDAAKEIAQSKMSTLLEKTREGAVAPYKNELAVLSEKVRELKAQYELDAKQRELEAHEQMEALRVRRDQEIASLRERFSEGTNENIMAIRRDLETSNRLIEDKDAQIRSLNTELRSIGNDNRNLISKLEREVARKDDKIKQLEEDRQVHTALEESIASAAVEGLRTAELLKQEERQFERSVLQ